MGLAVCGDGAGLHVSATVCETVLRKDASSILPEDDNGLDCEGLLASIIKSSLTNSIQESSQIAAFGSNPTGSTLVRETKKAFAASCPTALGGVPSLDTLISSALQATPQAALAWAGVTFAMQIFVNPASESKSNHDGIIHVISRMKWYCELSVPLLREDTVDAEASAGVRGQLEQRVSHLYEALLLYLIRSVYAFSRNCFVAFTRDSVKLDDWEGSINGVAEQGRRHCSLNTLQTSIAGSEAGYDP